MSGNTDDKSHHNTIRVIETRYADCHFRSRLEARWAVFFDAMGWVWSYEPEGYELPSGRYLPDFSVLPRGAEPMWIEIKGGAPTPAECLKVTELCAMTGIGGAILYGPIAARMAEFGHEFAARAWVADYGRGGKSWGFLRCYEMDGYADGEPTDSYLCLPGDPARVTRAAAVARSARFEFGQSGAAS